MNDELRLQVLLVEDDPDDLRQLERDLPEVFLSHGVAADIHPCEDFDDATARTSNPLYRYDLIVSDTYKGSPQNLDAQQVMDMVAQYQGRRFCPLVIYSSSSKPPELHEGAFLIWADKVKPRDIERAIGQLLTIGIPQLARELHEQLDSTAGSFLWGFLEQKWEQLNKPSQLSSEVLARIIRKRAAIQIGDMDPESEMAGMLDRDASEYYIYPAFRQEHYNLGDVLRAKQDTSDWRVVLTPHCHLFKQPNQEKPRADHVLLSRAYKAESVLGNKLKEAKTATEPKQRKKLLAWSSSPAQTDRTPKGRHWYLPGFLEIPHLFCDFMRVESVEYETLDNFERIATLASPYAEALQSCFAGFYASIGIPSMRTKSIEDLLFPDGAIPEQLP